MVLSCMDPRFQKPVFNYLKKQKPLEKYSAFTIASATGVSVDLESAAQGLGYDSFASAVEAYNQQHGTNYTAEQAREPLGQ